MPPEPEEDLRLDEVRLLDAQLGWDVFEICQAHDDAKKNPPEPPVFPDLEALTEAKMAEWARAARFHRNGGDVSLVHSATLAERVALTLMQQNPDLTAAEALGRVKTTVRRLRQDLQHEIELSRSVPEPEPEESPPREPSPELHNPPPFDLADGIVPDLLDYQIGDPDVLVFLKTGSRPLFYSEPAHRRKELRRQIEKRSRMFHYDGTRLYRLSTPKPKLNQPPPPGVLRKPALTKEEAESVIRHLHDNNGHPSIKQTKKLITDRFFWKDMGRDIHDHVRSCHYCQLANQPTTERTDGRVLKPTETDVPWEKVGLDLLGPFPNAKGGYQYVALLEDYHTHYLLGGLLHGSDTKGVADFLRRELYSHHGSPALIVMDNALAVGEVKELCQERGTRIHPMPSNSPWINGLAESAVKHSKRSLKKLRARYGDDWPDHFYDLLFSHRICVRGSTLLSSFQMVYGRPPVLPIERLFAQRYQTTLASTEEEFDRVMEGCLADVIETRRLNALLRATRTEYHSRAAAFNQDVRQQRAIEAFRKRQHRGVYRAAQLTPGCKVIMRKPRRQGPLDLGWEGPYFFVGFMDEDAQVAILEDANQLRWSRSVTLIHAYREPAAAL
jgi:transposase